MNILIEKSRRELICFRGETVLLRARVQLGFGCEDGPKIREGDGRTPEGLYLISSKNPASKFHLALGLSYPNPDDARRGYELGLIDKATFDAILASSDRPPWNTPLGGFIMIHGQPKVETREGDWTAGCVALSNEDMERLFAVTEIGHTVEIRP